MPNSIKYSTTGDTLSLRKGNLYFGTGDVGKGPSSVTQHYNGVTPNGGGYTIYFYDPRQPNNIGFDPISSDVQLISYTNGISGQNFTGATQCFNWYATQTNYTCVNKDYEGIVTNGLVLDLDAGFLPSYGTSGTTWYDLGYSGNNGTLTNGPTYSSLDGGYISFDGVDDYVSCGNPTNLQITQGTISAWVKTSSPGSDFRGIITKQRNYGIFIRNGLLTTYDWGSNTERPTSINVADGTWKNVVMTFTTNTGNPSNNAIIYLNGVPVLTTTIKYDANTVEVQIGNGGVATQYINGYITQAKIYNRVLSAQEILQNYNAGLSRFNTPNIVKSNLVLNLDASNSVSYPTTGTTWTDLSGDGYNGTLTNGPTFDSTSKSIVFDGVDDIVVLTGTTNVNYTTNISIEYVFKYNTAPTGYAYHILTKGKNTLTNSSFVDYLLKDFGGVRLMYSANAGGSWKTISKYSQPLSANTWYHACWTYDSTLGSNLYVNTIIATGGTSGAGVLATNTEPIRIGDVFYGGHSFFNGNVDYVRIYDRTLSQSEVLQNYYGGPIITSGLVMYLDAGNLVSYSGAGTTWYDLTTNGNNATFYNGVGFSSTNGGGIVFDGVDDYAVVLANSSLNSSQPTVELFMTTTTNGGNIIAQGQYGSNWGYGVGVKSGSILARNNGGDSNFSVSNSGLVHVVVVYDGSGNQFYKNGVFLGRTTTNYSPNPGGQVTIGGVRSQTPSQNLQEFANSTVSVVRIYNRALSADEISQNYNAQKSRFGL